MHYFLGIDIGTTHTKAALVTEDGTSFFGAKKGYGLLRPQPGFEEQDVTVILEAVTEVISQALHALPGNGKLAAIGFSAAMHSLLAVDEKGRPLCPGMTWADTRSSREAEELQRHPDAEQVYNHTGIPFHPMSPLCKIVWLRKHRPEIFNQAARFISIKEYVLWQLCGSYFIDYSLAAATGLFDIRQNRWDAQALQMAGISEDRLSEPVPPLYQHKGLTPYYSQLFKLKDIILVAGASDGCLANYGSGAANHGEMALTIGTSGAVRMTVRFPDALSIPLPGSERLFTYPLAGDLYVQGGAINNGGIILQWLARLFLSGDIKEEQRYDTLLSMAQQAPPGANGLIFLPYLLGERAPVWDADAKGVLLGLSMNHGREHIARAALEGICFSLYQLITRLEKIYGPVPEIYASGGFTRSAFWVQLLADLTGKRIKINDTADASAMGAAFLAMYATGFLKDLSAIKPFIQVSKEYEPGAESSALYARLFSIFVSLYPKLEHDFAALSRPQEN